MRYILKGLLLGWAIGLAGALFGLSTYGTLFERSVGLDWLFSVRGAIAAPQSVAVVAIDSRTGPRLGMSALPREWPRSIHGELIDKLVEMNAAAIVFDIDFHKPRSAADEALFAEAARRSERVVLFQHLTGKRQPVEDASGKIRGTVWVEELLSPVEPLTEAARGLGPFPLPKIEAAVYEFWVFKSSAREAPTMPAAAFQLYALEAYDAFHRLLGNSGVLRHVEIAESAAQIASASDLLRLMTSLRDIVIERPMLALNLRQELQQPWVQQQSARIRYLLHSLVSMYIGSNERLLNFYGPPGTIKTIPYHAVIKGEDPNLKPADLDFSNTVVFVGFSDLYDPGQVDRFYTVFTDENSIDLSGVEIAATAFGNLLHDESIITLDGLSSLAVLFCFGVVITMVIYFTPTSVGIPLSIVLVVAFGYYAQTLFNDSQLWLPLATPVLVQFPLGLFAGLLARYMQQHHKLEHISQAISLYVPAEVSRALTGGELDTSKINQVTFSTCLSTDMQGFSTIAEHMRPAELAVFLNDYFDALAKPLSDYDVTVTEFRADAIMCAWTGDESDIEIRRKPILASLQAADAIEDFKARHEAFETSLRIGMSTGEVYVGHSGGGGHFVYSIVGDCANTASRIESLNKHLGSQILATAATLDGIDNLLLRPVGDFVFVGKTEPLPIVEIFSLSGDATRKQIDLSERFTDAMERFGKGNWRSAATLFRGILRDYPQDGPSRFYATQCQQRLQAESLPEDPWVINMDRK